MGLQVWFPISCVSIVWELPRTPDSWAPPRPTKPEAFRSASVEKLCSTPVKLEWMYRSPGDPTLIEILEWRQNVAQKVWEGPNILHFLEAPR